MALSCCVDQLSRRAVRNLVCADRDARILVVLPDSLIYLLLIHYAMAAAHAGDVATLCVGWVRGVVNAHDGPPSLDRDLVRAILLHLLQMHQVHLPVVEAAVPLASRLPSHQVPRLHPAKNPTTTW